MAEGLPTLPVLLHDLLSAMSGDPIMCRLDNGTECLLRLYRPEEFLEYQHAVVDQLRLQVPDAGEKVTLARARELTAPVSLDRLVHRG